MTDYSMKQPLSYEPLKSILANMDLVTRENIARQMPSLRKTNEVVPYTFGSYFMEENRRNDYDLYDRSYRRLYTNIQIGDLFQRLNNKHILLEISDTRRWTEGMGLDLFRSLTRHWLNTEKQVGSTFTFPHYDSEFITEILFDLPYQTRHLGAYLTKISKLGDGWFADCAVIPMNENLEIVAFGTRYGDRTGSEGMYEWALKMVIEARGTTSVPRIF